MAAARKLGRPLLFVTSNEVAAQRVREDLNALLGGGAALLPARDISFVRTAASSRELTMRRLEALGAAATGEAKAMVMSAETLLCRQMPRERFLQNVLEITPDMRVEPTELVARLVEAGYERTALVEARGQCALRGGILDVYPVGMPEAVRLEFFDDEVDSLRAFDVMTSAPPPISSASAFTPPRKRCSPARNTCARRTRSRRCSPIAPGRCAARAGKSASSASSTSSPTRIF